MANNPLFNISGLDFSGVADAIDRQKSGVSNSAFGKLLEAIRAGATPAAPKLKDPALNFGDVKKVLPFLIGLEGLAGRGGAVEPFLAGARERKASSVATENANAQTEADRANAQSRAAIDIARLASDRAESDRQEFRTDLRYAEGVKERRQARLDTLSDKAEARQDKRVGGLVDNWERALEKSNPTAIKQAALALKNLPNDVIQKYSLYVPSDRDVDAALDEARQKNRQWAIENWDKFIDRYRDDYGFVSDEDAPKLLRRAYAIARQGYLDPEDAKDIFFIPTAKTLGMKKLDEVVRHSQAVEGEAKRHNQNLESEARKRIANDAARIEIARGHLGVARKNADTHALKARREASVAQRDMEALYKKADTEMRSLNAEIAKVQAQIKAAPEDKRGPLRTKLAGLEAEHFYWKQAQFEAAGASKEARDILQFVNGLPGFARDSALPNITVTLPPGGAALPSGPINGGAPGPSGSPTAGGAGSAFTKVRG